jgi:hypothetical protein
VKSSKRLIGFVLIASIAAAIYFSRHRPKSPEEASAPASQPSPTSTVSPSPTAQYPMPADTASQTSFNGDEAHSPLPTSVDESDNALEEALKQLFGKTQFDSFFHAKDIVRRIVVTIDNVSARKQPSYELTPFKPLSPGFRTTGKGDERLLSASNFERYRPLVDLARTVDAEQLVAIYRHFYPLFQSAYRDLGTQGYFNDRVVAVIDHLLKTPQPKEPIRVLRYGAHDQYKYADPALESLSSGQKVLLRIGNENAQFIKLKLLQIRKLLVRFQ